MSVDNESEYLGQTTYPSNPETGRRVFRTDLGDDGQLMRYDGSSWVAIGGGGGSTIPVQTGAPTAPTSPSTETELWYDSDYEPFANADYSSVGLRASRTSSQSMASGSWGRINTLNNSIEKNTGGWTFDWANNAWVVPQSGWYVLHGRANWAASSSGVRRLTEIRLNGTTLGSTTEFSSPFVGNSWSQHNTQIAYLTENDLLTLWVFQDSGSALNITNANFEAALVGGTQGPKGETGDVFAAATTAGLQSYGGSYTYALSTRLAAQLTTIRKNTNITVDSTGVYVIQQEGWYTTSFTCYKNYNGGYNLVRILIDPGDGSADYTLAEQGDGSENYGRSSCTGSAYLYAGDKVKPEVYFSTSGSTSSVEFSIARTGGVKGDKGDKGDTGNLPSETGIRVNNSTGGNTTASTNTVIPFDYVDRVNGEFADTYTDGGSLSGANGVTIPRTGWYLVQGYIWGTTTGDCYVRPIVDTGSGWATVYAAQNDTTDGTSKYRRVEVSTPLYLEAGDKVGMYGYTSTAISMLSWTMAVVAIGGPQGPKGDTGNLPHSTGFQALWTGSITTSGWTTVGFTTVQADTESGWDGTAKTYTIPYEGFWDLGGQVKVGGTPGTGEHLVEVRVNGNEVVTQGHDNRTGWPRDNASRVVWCSVGDTVSWLWYNTTGQAVTTFKAHAVLTGGPKGDKGDAGYVPEGDTAWRTPTLLNSWANYDTTTFGPVGYRKDANGFVHLRGLVKNGSSSGATIFNLPAGYRPGRTVILSAATALSSASGTASDFRIETTGIVRFHGGGSTSWSSIHATFYAEA